MWFFTIIFWVLFLAGLFLILTALLEKKDGSISNQHIPADSALAILQKRYASGEINDETFKRMKSELEG